MMRVLQSTPGLLLTAALLTITLLTSALAADATAPAADAHPRVAIDTTQGSIVIELDRDKAPITVNNFLSYVKEGHYNGTIFHRVIGNFMIQGGGYGEDFQRKPSHDPITNEADNGLKNTRGSIAMARTGDPHSATAQFFINVADNDFLDFTAKTRRGWGYTVFGHIIEGMDTAERILAIPTGRGGPFPKDVPQTTVMINSVTLLPADAPSQPGTAVQKPASEPTETPTPAATATTTG